MQATLQSNNSLALSQQMSKEPRVRHKFEQLPIDARAELKWLLECLQMRKEDETYSTDSEALAIPAFKKAVTSWNAKYM